MYTKVLATVNEYSNSEIAAHYAVIFAKACKASLTLLYVDPAGSDPEAFNRAEAALKRLFLLAESHGVEVESLTESGDPLKKIISLVKRGNIDIVFTSTRKEDVKRQYFTRTLSRELLLKLPCAVALVRIVHAGKLHPRRILVPLRGRIADAEERARFVAACVRGFASTLTLFHTSGRVSSFLRGELHSPPGEREQRLSGDIMKFVGHLNRHQIAHDRRTGHGSIAHSIAIEAMIRRNDLIIMGASERGLLKSALYGNPVEEILRETPCNLIIFKAKRQ